MIALPLSTDRLLVRRFAPGEAATLAAYRSHPDVARYQGWVVPYPEAEAARLLADQADLAGPTPGRWVQLAVEVDATLVGDVAVHLDDTGRLADVGYTLDPAHQGRGLATEAVGAVVDALLADGVHRVVAGVDPANRPSRRVLERLGFRCEGVARRAYPLGDGEWADDERWAVLADERRDWLRRPTGAPGSVELVELEPATVHRYGALEVHPTQRHLVATMGQSFADACVPGRDDGGGAVVPWFRGVAADGEPAGFVMTTEPTHTSPEPYLWRLLVDRRHQGRGVGATVVRALADRYRAAGHTSLTVSWVPGPGSPEPFYVALGFVPTGEVDHGEVVARLDLTAAAAAS